MAAGAVDADLRRLLRGFEGAWPYLELIASGNGIADPLDERVVEAYWVGNALLDRVGNRRMGDSMEDRIRVRRAGPSRTWWHRCWAAPSPHHSFHVFGVYPWLGLLREDRLDEPLRVLDRCRIRWGQVQWVSGGEAVVLSRPLAWDGRRLGFGGRRWRST